VTTEAAYVAELLRLYHTIPSAPLRVRPADRALARSLFQRNVPLEIVRAALLLATSRRIHRPLTAPPLQPVRSLHYYLPVIQELLDVPPPPGYVEYLTRKIATPPCPSQHGPAAGA
jgi:hypothetical protein